MLKTTTPAAASTSPSLPTTLRLLEIQPPPWIMITTGFGSAIPTGV